MNSDQAGMGQADGRLDYFHPEVATKFENGVALHRTGDLDGAELAYREVLRMTVDHPGALNLIGTIHHQKGDHREAIEFLDKAIEIAPNNPDFFNNRGAAYFSLSDFENAALNFETALGQNPDDGSAHGNLTSALLELGRSRDAYPHAMRAAELQDDNFKYVKRLGDICLELSKFDEAVDAFERCLQLTPGDAEIMNNLGYAHERRGDLLKTEECYRKALEFNPRSPEIANNLASVLSRQGKRDEAKIFYDQALEAAPDDWSDVINVAGTYLNSGDFAKAIASFEQGVVAQPENPDMWAGYANALAGQGSLQEADVAFAKSLDINPDQAEVWNNRGNNSFRGNELEKATQEFKKAIDLAPRYPEPHINVCLCLMFQFKIDEAYMYAHTAMSLPRSRQDFFANSNKVFRGTCDFDGLAELGDLWSLLEGYEHPDVAACFLEMLPLCSTPEETQRLVDLHFRWGSHYVHSQGSDEPLPPRTPRSPSSKLKIAFLSSDLRAHSVSNFALPVFRYYDRSEVEIHCFAPNAAPGDAMQHKIRSLVDGFHVLENMSRRDAALAIQEQGIDVAFELNGFTRDTMIKSLRFRPAPVQIYWLGYPFTTGMKEMDHILVDKYFAPENPDWLCEEPLYMPESWVCFDEFPEVAISDRVPVERNGFLTFGTLNNPYKFTLESIATWATIMNEFEDSQFLLVRPEADSLILQTNLREHFARCGVAPERLKFINNWKLPHRHFSYYDLIDISLDTFPQTGGTTTCDAIWMGVPVVSLVGPSMHQRVSYSLLENAGCGELCCFSLEEYLEKAVMLGNDIASLREYRHGMRPALLNSPLCQGERFTENFQKVVFSAFEKSGA